MRIVDYLHDGGGDDGVTEISKRRRRRRGSDLAASPSPRSSSFASSSSDSSSPRSLLSRWLLTLRKPSPGGGSGGEGSPRWYRSRNKKKKKGEEEEGLEEGGALVSPLVADPPVARTEGGSGVPPPGSSSQGGGTAGNEEGSAELSVLSGGKPEAVSFNIGIGACLVLLLARSATEFGRMIELQRQMETLLKEVKDEVQRKVTIPGFSESNDNTAVSVSDCCDGLNSSITLSLQNYRDSLDREGAKSATVSNEQLCHDGNIENRRCPKMDQLEAELEIELERLQFNLEGEGSSVHSGPNQMELSGDNSDPSGCFTISFGEYNERNEEHQNELHGVNACDLERRLHELQETRQQERIVELESALERAERKLCEKEMEVSWWRDIATHVSQK